MHVSGSGRDGMIRPSGIFGTDPGPLIFRLDFPDALQIKAVCTPGAASGRSARVLSEAQAALTDPLGVRFPQPDLAGPVAFCNDPHVRHWPLFFLPGDLSGRV